MPLADSRSEYERRMHRVLEHIDRRLDQPLELAALAEVAHFSPFHFHRLFVAWMGETLGDYIRRRRVEVGAMRLLAQPKLSVLEAALSVGFGSGEAFARAFKIRFGVSPSAWRKGGATWANAMRNPDQADRNPDQAASRGDAQAGIFANEPTEIPMDIKLLDRVATPVAYLRYTGPYGAPVGHFWQREAYPWLVAHGLLGQPRYGIAHDDPDITDAKRCRYDACAEWPAESAAPRAVLTTTIPGGRYAALRFYGTSSEIEASWRRLLRDWLPSSGYQLDARPCFEHYPTDGRYDPKTGAFECDLCAPVAPL